MLIKVSENPLTFEKEINIIKKASTFPKNGKKRNLSIL